MLVLTHNRSRCLNFPKSRYALAIGRGADYETPRDLRLFQEGRSFD